jgi:hypothetical protein
VREPLLQAFPFPSIGKGDTAPALSGLRVYLQFMWEVGLPPSPVSFLPTATFTSFPAPAYWAVLLLLPAAMFIYSSRGKWVFPPLLWSFSPSATLTSFPTPGCWVRTLLLSEALWPAPLVYLQSQEGFPTPNLQRSGHSTLFPACLNYSYCLLLSFSFFPQVEVGLSRELCCSGPGLSMGVPRYCKAHLVCIFPSHMGTGHWWPRGPSSFLHLM